LNQFSAKSNYPKYTPSKSVKAGLKILPYFGEVADTLRLFVKQARHDPFDRMFLAQAKSLKLQFFTADQTILDLKLSFVHDARL